MKRYFCFTCELTFLSDNKSYIHFSNKYGDWVGIKCKCGGMAKHIGQEYNVGTGTRTRLQEQRNKYAKDLIQPYIGGERFNPDFKKAYPDKALEMVKEGVITKKEYQDA